MMNFNDGKITRDENRVNAQRSAQKNHTKTEISQNFYIKRHKVKFYIH